MKLHVSLRPLILAAARCALSHLEKLKACDASYAGCRAAARTRKPDSPVETGSRGWKEDLS